MRIVFVSNYYTHHQSPLSEELAAMTDVSFYFIETEKMEQERLEMGWSCNKPNFVLNFLSNKELCCRIIVESDVVVFGNSPLDLVKIRTKTKKLTFFYSERIYKKGFSFLKYPLRFIKINKRYNHKRFFLLCASAYAAYDYSRTMTFIGKSFKWGYFPKTYQYFEVDRMIDLKKPHSILWAGRFIEVKHPEVPIMLAERLKEMGIDFQINMIGDGTLRSEIEKTISEKKLNRCVNLLGVKNPAETRLAMENSEIFLFTSDSGEGWGAVVNESMNGCCAVVANRAAGSVPFLIENGVNGFMYKDGDFDSLLRFVVDLLLNDEKRKEIGKNAYHTICEYWNSAVAARRLVELSKQIQSGSSQIDIFSYGPCSVAKIIKG